MNKTIHVLAILLASLFLLAGCLSEEASSSRNPIQSSSFSESFSHLSEPTAQASLIINPSDIKSKEVDSFYSIHSLADDKFLIHAGRNNGEAAYLITYDLDSSSDTYISDLLDPVLNMDVINETTFCLSTYTQTYIIKNDKISDIITLPPEKTFDFRYDFISNSLCYVDDNSNLLMENIESNSYKTVYAADFIKTESNSKSSSDGIHNSIIERGANPIFFNNRRITFVKIGTNDFSPLLIYDIKSQTVNEYPVEIFVYSYMIQPFDNELVITSHEDNAQKIYTFHDDSFDIHDIGITYDLTYKSIHDLLLKGTDQALYRINLDDFTAHKLYSAGEGNILRSATSTKNYAVILQKNQDGTSSILILPK